MTRLRLLSTLAIMLLPGITAAAHLPDHPSFIITREGEPAAIVVISGEEEKMPMEPRGEANVETAALEFISYIQKISGVELPLLRHAAPTGSDFRGKRPILLGKAALSADLSAQARHALEDPSGFVLRITPECIAVAGSTPRGTEIGVHALLEELGVRWFFPGQLGTVIPSRRSLALAPTDRAERPSFPARHYQIAQPSKAGEWVRHQRVGGIYFGGAHNIQIGEGIAPETHPQYYALVNGVRQGPQLCVSNPEVLRLAIAETRQFFRKHPEKLWRGLGPADAAGYCQCDGCTAWDGGDWDAFSHEPSVTDRYITFFNKILEAIGEEFPDRKLAFYIYHNYMRPPVKVRPDPRIMGAIAPIALCRIHGMNNPVCPERGYLKEIIEGWQEALPGFYERGYWFNLADPGMLFSQVHRLRDEIPAYAARGCLGFRTECMGHWAAEGPSLYVAGRLMWNTEADVEAILDDYCLRLFGAGGDAMRRYFSLLDRRLEDADHHAGSAFSLLDFYPRDFREKVRKELEAAAATTANTPEGERVALFRKGFDYTEAFARMLEARNAHRWGEALNALGEMDRLREELLAYDVPMLNPKAAEAYLRRFFRLPVEQGAARAAQAGGAIIALGDVWQSLADPQNLGETLHYENPHWTGGNWQPVRTFSTTWSDVGLRYYKGLAWYRQTVELPEALAGERLFLWMGGVDEQAKVWVNGTLIGNGPGSAFTPFELDATRAVRPGANVVTVCVANLRTDELGTGGIVAPAFFYRPAKGAEPENVKPLRNTFP